VSLITPTEVRARIETDLPDAEIQRAIDAEEAAIIDLFGAHTANIVETRRPGEGDERLTTSRPISAVVSITETYTATYGETTTTLAASDYAVEGRRTIRRKIGGTYPRTEWAPLVTITYTPTADTARRSLALMDLVHLAITYSPTSQETVGDVRTQTGDRDADRAKILRRLDTGRLIA